MITGHEIWGMMQNYSNISWPVLQQGMFPMIFALIIGIIAFIISYYIYMGFAFTSIAKKAKLKSPGIAWIPGVGPLIIAFQASKMHWWPWLLIIGMFIPLAGFLFRIAFGVFVIVWEWKMFEKIKRPGWWAILMIVPILNWVIIGIAAWSKK